MNLTEIKEKYTGLRAKEDVLKNQIENGEHLIEEKTIRLNQLIKARLIIIEVTRQTQNTFKKVLEAPVTMAIGSVFNRDFKFELIFEEKRNKSECRPIILENGEEFEPKDEMGGSIIDIISFANRVVLWSLQKPRSRATFILDEPMKWVGKGEQTYRVGKMLKEISKKLGVQIIFVTHEPKLAEISDRAWKVEYVNGRSIVTEMTSKTILEQAADIMKKLPAKPQTSEKKPRRRRTT